MPTRLYSCPLSLTPFVRSSSLSQSHVLTGREVKVWSKITAGPGVEIEVKDLNPFLIVTFADLKKYRYYYWCGFPALLQKPGWEAVSAWEVVGEDVDEVGVVLPGGKGSLLML